MSISKSFHILKIFKTITPYNPHPEKLENLRILVLGLYNYFMKKEKKEKTAKQLERHLKGVANHYRIEILFLVSENKNITLLEIAESLNANEKTIGEHTRRLVQAGLLNKSYNHNHVEHYLSPYGKHIVKYLKNFRKI